MYNKCIYATASTYLTKITLNPEDYTKKVIKTFFCGQRKVKIKNELISLYAT